MAQIPKTKTYNPKNFMGRGVNSPESGTTPNETGPMGMFWGTAFKNPMGKMRSDSIGYIPVSKKKLGTAPTQVV
jgi:hypothetical protein